MTSTEVVKALKAGGTLVRHFKSTAPTLYKLEERDLKWRVNVSDYWGSADWLSLLEDLPNLSIYDNAKPEPAKKTFESLCHGDHRLIPAGENTALFLTILDIAKELDRRFKRLEK